ncbi:MAG: porin [bacterium]
MRIKKIAARAVLCILLAGMVGFIWPVQVQAEDLTIGGTIDLDIYGYKNKNTTSQSDIKLDALELSIASKLSEQVSANALVKYEYNGEDYNLFVDEAYVTLSKLIDQPFTITAGKWYLPFGVFNNHLTTDPLTEDAYEICSPAVSFSIAPEEVEGLDLSLTLYSNREGLFADDDPNTDRDVHDGYRRDDLGNYILNASLAQMEMIELSVYYCSEQGVGGDRNDSMGASLSATFQQNFTFDVEYIEAIDRDDNHPEDSAYSISGAFKVLPPLELVGRFEGYDDGVSGDQAYDPDSLEGVEYRVSAGANYELIEHATLMSEFRVTEVEDPDVSNVKEWTLRLRVEF